MNRTHIRSTGASLVIGSLLGVATMVLHPVGGTMDHIRHISPMIRATHGLAIASFLVLLFGLVNLCTIAWEQRMLALLALILLATGSAFVMLAGTLNGFVLPSLASPTDSSQLSENVALIRYNHALNQVFANVFIATFAAGYCALSFAFLRLAETPRWLGVLGVTIGIGCACVLVLGFNLLSVRSFGLVVGSLCLYTVIWGLYLLTQPDRFVTD